MAVLDLGKVKFTWKGAWMNAHQYEVDDVFNWFDDLFVFRIQLCSWV